MGKLTAAEAEDIFATAAELARMDANGRSPLKMLEEARWHARQGRQVRAFAGLHSETLASADSRRLALFALEAPLLQALPPQAPDLGTWHRVSVHKDCHVKFERILYSPLCCSVQTKKNAPPMVQ